jgi:hypothetical protein
MAQAHGRERFTLEIEHPARQIAVGAVPERVDAERLHIDAILVHICDALSRNRKAKIPLELPACRSLEWGAFDNVEHGRHGTVRVHVHGFDPAAAHGDFAAHWDRGRLGERMSEAATDADHAGRCRRGMFQKPSTIEHGIPPEQNITRDRQRKDFSALDPFRPRPAMSLRARQRIAIGATAEPVPPLIFRGCTMKANS